MAEYTTENADTRAWDVISNTEVIYEDLASVLREASKEKNRHGDVLALTAIMFEFDINKTFAVYNRLIALASAMSDARVQRWAAPGTGDTSVPLIRQELIEAAATSTFIKSDVVGKMHSFDIDDLLRRALALSKEGAPN